MKKILLSIISIPILTLLIVYTFIIISIVLPFSLIKGKKWFYAIVNFWAKSVFVFLCKKVEIEGLENINKNENYILVANHGSMFDIMAIMSIFPKVSWLGKDKLMKIPLFGAMLRVLNYVPMKTIDVKNTKNMIDKMSENAQSQTVAIFPEGTRTLTGELGKFKKGFVHVFRATEQNILPVTLNGFYNFKPKGRPYIKFNSKLKIVINSVLSNEDLKQMTNEEIVEKVNFAISSSYKKN